MAVAGALGHPVALGGERAVAGSAAVSEDLVEAEDGGVAPVEGADDDGADRLAVDGGKRQKARRGCPSRMVRVSGFCMDRFEAPNRAGEKPLVMQSANDGEAWCSSHGKRLCTEDEWMEACAGEARRAYPYGGAHVEGRCTDDRPWRTVDEARLGKWPAAEASKHLEEIYQATPSGERRQCVSEAGVHDLTGNVEEWVVRTREHANAYPYVLIGCYWSGCYGGGKPTCHSTNNAHGADFRFYETGFRCCRDVVGSR